MEKSKGLKNACPEEIAWRNGWISDKELEDLSKVLLKSSYGVYLQSLLNA